MGNVALTMHGLTSKNSVCTLKSVPAAERGAQAAHVVKTPVGSKHLSVYAQELLPSFLPPCLCEQLLFDFYLMREVYLYVLRNDYLDRNSKSQIAIGK